MSAGTQKVIAIGASTGGVAALKEVLVGLPKAMPPILIVQHMPPAFTNLFAKKLSADLKLSVKEAETGDLSVPGKILIALGGKHMKLIKKEGTLAVECFLGKKVQSVIPSVDVLFNSVADLAGQNAIGIILTGIGGDGARGLLKMRKVGAKTIGQDRGSCEIYGMPKLAIEMGAVEYILPLEHIGTKIMSLIAGK